MCKHKFSKSNICRIVNSQSTQKSSYSPLLHYCITKDNIKTNHFIRYRLVKNRISNHNMQYIFTVILVFALASAVLAEASPDAEPHYRPGPFLSLEYFINSIFKPLSNYLDSIVSGNALQKQQHQQQSFIQRQLLVDGNLCNENYVI